MTTRELDGRIAIVTGAGRNIGRAIALTLAEGGASILVNARGDRAEAEAVAREIEANGGKALVHIGDVADANAVQAMADAAMKQFGRIDCLVNNAALRREKKFAEMDYREWREILDVTLDGTFHCVKACLPALRKSGAGTIVIVVSDDGPGGADPGKGSGLTGLADRVDALGGSFRVESAPGRGTRLAATIPLGGQER